MYIYIYICIYIYLNLEGIQYDIIDTSSLYIYYTYIYTYICASCF